jgi:Tol biopolymer transport system component
MAGPLRETDHVIGHELVHAFQMDITGGDRSSGSSEPAISRMPLWFVEGMAEYLSLGPDDPHTAMWMRDAARANKLPTIQQLEDPRFFPYRYGQALWAYVAGRFGDAVVGTALRTAGHGTPAARAIAIATSTGEDTLRRDWHQAIRDWYAPLAAGTRTLETTGKVVVRGGREERQMNLAPALSPDGRLMTYLSEQSRFAVELYLADATTGHTIRHLTRATVDPHLESVGFIQSAAAFSADGRRVAYGVIESGRPELEIYDVRAQRVTRRMPFRELDEIQTPTWSPDGSSIAFAGLEGGLTDLFVADVATGALRRLTRDPWADLEPSWSPDGRRIAFVTDQFGGDLDQLAFGDYRLALIDVVSGAIHEVPGFEHAKHIDPQWSPDGSALYCVSDHGGISDVYRVPLDGGALTQVTRLATGVSGITALSPALSVARATGRLMFSAYQDGSYSLVAIDAPEVLAGFAPVTPGAAVTHAGAVVDSAGVLPPAGPRTGQQVRSLVQDPVTGLVTSDDFHHQPYRARLSLDNFAQASIGVGTSHAGVSGSGGATLLWSDMLGDQHLLTLIQYQSVGNHTWRNLGGGLGYLNSHSRLHWGGQITQTSIPTVDFITDTGLFQGEPAYRQQEFRYWEIERDALAEVQYPFSRAQRIELSAGVRNVDFASEVETHIYSAITGAELAGSIQPTALDSVPSLNLALASVALVYDNSYFGGTSPLLGQSYRFEVTPVTGSVQYLSVLADYRRYVQIARPFTLAGRILHAGRYGSGSDDYRLSDLFVGYPWLVRGYDANSFTADECPTGDCIAFDRLQGTRIGVGNVELRVPVIGGIGLIQNSSVPPIEIAGFFDAGVAWSAGQPAPFSPGAPKPVTSQGVAFRMNLFGFAVGELDYVRPNDRPQRGWMWRFNFQPGF